MQSIGQELAYQVFVMHGFEKPEHDQNLGFKKSSYWMSVLSNGAMVDMYLMIHGPTSATTIYAVWMKSHQMVFTNTAKVKPLHQLDSA